jgi:hypothetical protein
MPKTTGFQWLDVLNGGWAENGQKVFATLRLGGPNGTTQDISLFADHEKLPPFLMALMEFGGQGGQNATSTTLVPTPKERLLVRWRPQLRTSTPASHSAPTRRSFAFSLAAAQLA